MDELNKEQLEEKVEEVVEVEEKVEDAPPAATEETTEPPSEPEVAATEEPPVEGEPEKTDETPTEEIKEGTEGEEPAEDIEVTEPEQSVDIEKIKAEIEEEKAILAEEKAIIEFERKAKADEIQLANTEAAIADALARSFKDLGIDTEKTLDEIRKEDPEKAFRAQQLIMEAQRTHEAVVNAQHQAARARLQDLVFTKASRLLEKFGLSKEETPVVAETFVNIINEVGIKNLDDDLVAKVELAVGRAKLIVPKVEKAVEQVKEIAEDVKDTVNELMTPAPEEEPPVVHTEEPKIELDEFKEGATIGQTKAEKSSDGILAELASITDPRKRVAFYKENFALIEKAMRTHSPAVDRGSIKYGK
ncbi:MAG: hypothetical protein NC218_08205 [Acetobacter sp.]|nr:hypothetical protein [Acetobacter sp.]